MPPFTRASDLDRILRCTGSLSLVTLKGPDSTKRSDGLIKAGNWGTDMHYVKETGLIPEHRKDDGPFTRKAVILLEERETYWPAGMGRHEVSFAYDVITGEVRVLMSGTDDERKAWKESQSDACVVGTSDWVGRAFDDVLHVDDLKTGHQEPNPESHQNMFYSLVAATLKGEENVVMSSTHFPRYPVAHRPNRIFAGDEFYARNVDGFKTMLRKAHEVYKRERRPKYEAGPYQCAYCPVKEKCPV